MPKIYLTYTEKSCIINKCKEVIFMPRKALCRKVCRLPKARVFIPSGKASYKEIILSVEEYEAIRLIDREGFSQEECGKFMGVARTTAQQIYAKARKKIADALVEGKTLHIKGGDYRLCDGQEEKCGCGGCQKHKICKGED